MLNKITKCQKGYFKNKCFNKVLCFACPIEGITHEHPAISGWMVDHGGGDQRCRAQIDSAEGGPLVNRVEKLRRS